MPETGGRGVAALSLVPIPGETRAAESIAIVAWHQGMDTCVADG